MHFRTTLCEYFITAFFFFFFFFFFLYSWQNIYVIISISTNPNGYTSIFTIIEKLIDVKLVNDMYGTPLAP